MVAGDAIAIDIDIDSVTIAIALDASETICAEFCILHGGVLQLFAKGWRAVVRCNDSRANFNR